MTKYYAVGGSLNVIDSVDFGGYGHYMESITPSFMNNILFNHCNRGVDLVPTEKVYLFEKKEDAILVAESLKQTDIIDNDVIRFPVFEIETDERLIFINAKARDIIDFNINTCNLERKLVKKNLGYPELLDLSNSDIRFTSVKNLDLANLKLNCNITNSFLVGYHTTPDGTKYHSRTLFAEAARPFFDTSFFLVLGLTFWTVVIPIAYAIYRAVVQYNAVENYKNSEDYRQYYPTFFANHDQESLKNSETRLKELYGEHENNDLTPLTI